MSAVDKAGGPAYRDPMLGSESLLAIGYGRGHAIAAFQLAQPTWTEA